MLTDLDDNALVATSPPIDGVQSGDDSTPCELVRGLLGQEVSGSTVVDMYCDFVRRQLIA